MKTLNNLALKVNAKFNLFKSKTTSFLKDQASVKTTTEEGVLTYAAVVLGIVILGLVFVWLTGGFTAIGNFFNDGITGKNTKPDGWGK
ncbi:hypothetical protein [Bacillus sp. 1P06AnD]|uniref:hypothetical protein n=1 Tax=Bacillus sp. 1P06AnD TaxID=3132208 RepID=UPI00399FCAF9